MRDQVIVVIFIITVFTDFTGELIERMAISDSRRGCKSRTNPFLEPLTRTYTDITTDTRLGCDIL